MWTCRLSRFEPALANLKFGYTPPPGCFCDRVWICLIAKGLTFLRATKSLQQYENNGFATEPPRTRGLARESEGVTPGGNADGYQNKGVAGKAIRKNMKTKG